MTPLLQVQDLKTQFFTGEGVARAVDDVSFELSAGEILGIVGESGCGKTVTALSIMRLLDPPGRVVAGRVLFDGRDLLELRPRAMAGVRGGEIAMIFQQPKGSLNPVQRIGWQIAEQFLRRRGMSRKQAWRGGVEMLSAVGISTPEIKARAYPHELSGGQAQRVMIAIALALHPRLLIADEPTTALDVTVQAQILRLLQERCRAMGTALILVTHDLGVIAQIADRVMVMYAGQIVEQGTVARVFARPEHPYTRGLLNSIPRLGALKPRLVEIAGMIPNLIRPSVGCRFAPRCDERIRRQSALCEVEAPGLQELGGGEAARCWFAGERTKRMGDVERLV